jgi:hypothetical protein
MLLLQANLQGKPDWGVFQLYFSKLSSGEYDTSIQRWTQAGQKPAYWCLQSQLGR